MSEELKSDESPRPWRVWTNRFGQHYIVCESGSDDRVRDYIAGPIQNESDAALIVAAVNERDRLRDVVRRLAEEVEQMEEIDTIALTDRAKRIEALIREARAAIGGENQ